MNEMEPIKLKENLTIHDAVFIKQYQFSCKYSAPLFEVTTIHAFNQIIGHAKFNNKDYGQVFYRGQCDLYETVQPSLIRNNDINKGPISVESATRSIAKQIQKILNDKDLPSYLKINGKDPRIQKLIVEAVLQHYGAPTRFIDLVDNHWIALWMGLNRIKTIKNCLIYNTYVERVIPYVDTIPVLIKNENQKGNLIQASIIDEAALYQYILLIALPNGRSVSPGIYETSQYTVIDLRQALPSTFLRPHAQHAFVAKMQKNLTEQGKHYYDFAKNVVGIIRIRIDRAHDWMGTGELLTQDNLFPPAAYDNGYDILLSRTDLFDGIYTITRYV